MERRNFIKGCFDCGLATMISSFMLQSGSAYSQEDESTKENKTTKNDLVQKVHPKQVRRLLKFIEKNFDKSDRKKIFSNLGYGCFYSKNRDKWIKSYKADLDSFFSWVNSGKSIYWEKLEYDKKNSKIKVISRKFLTCICAYAQCPDPPKSLCNYCCKGFQKVLFETLLDKKVEVKIDESILLGGKRCCTTVNIKT